MVSTSPAAALIDYRQALLGLASLLLGVLVYVIARPEGVLFLPQAFNFGHYFPGFIIELTGSLPVFFHVLGLSLLTASVLLPSKVLTVVICFSWAAINGLFEYGQHPDFVSWLNVRIPAGSYDNWLLQQVLAYFQRGTFDPADIAASILAAVIAYPLIVHTTGLRYDKLGDGKISS